MEAVMEKTSGNTSISRKALATATLMLSLFVIGFNGLCFEYTLSTTATNILGNSAEQWAITIGIMMFAMGLGAYLQQFIKTESPVTAFIGTQIGVAVLGGFGPIAMLACFAYAEHHFKLIFYLLAAVIGVLVGAEIPLATRIYEKYASGLKENIGRLFFADYAGAFAGAYVFVKYLLPKVSPIQMGYYLGAGALLIAVLSFLVFVEKASKKVLFAYAGSFVVVAVMLVFGFMNSKSWASSVEQRLYRDKIVYVKNTKYQHMVLTENTDKNEFRLYLNGNLQFSSLDEERYHDFLVHVPMSLTRKDKPIRVLILGGGDGFCVRELLKYSRIKSITLVDLDPGMTEFAKSHPIMTRLNHSSFENAKVQVYQSPGVREGRVQPIRQDAERSLRVKRPNPERMQTADVAIMNLDADQFLNAPIGRDYDLVIVDFPDPRTPELGKLYSQQFYRKIHGVLAVDGIAAVQSTSVYYSREPFLMVGRTLRASDFTVLPYHHEVPSFGDWGYHLFWQDGRTIEQVQDQIRSVTKLEVPTPYITPALLNNCLDFGNGVLDNSNFEGVINTLIEQKIYKIYNDSWVID